MVRGTINWRPVVVGTGTLVMLSLLGPISSASAKLIPTSSLDLVLPCASHVVRVRVGPKAGTRFVVERSLRGGLKRGVEVDVYAPQGVVRPAYFTADFRVGLGGPEVKLIGLVLALYEMDGRYHVVGQRPVHGVYEHSSVWLIGEGERVFTFSQVVNPGAPVPVAAKPADWLAFAANMEKQLKAYPFGGRVHRPIPTEERAAFRKLVEPSIRLYEHDLADWQMKSARRVALAKRIAAYGRSASPEMAVHAFDALGLLAPYNGYASRHQAELQKLMLGLVEVHGIEPFRKLILHELARGPYMESSPTVLLAIAKQSDEALYAEGVRILTALGLRMHFNEGLAAYYALRDNGEHKAAAVVRKAQQGD